MRCNLRPPAVAPVNVTLEFFGQFRTAHAHKLVFRSFDQYSGMAIKFSDLHFLTESNKLADRRHFHAVTLTCDSLHLNLNVCGTSDDTWALCTQHSAKSNNLSYWRFSTFSPSTFKSGAPTSEHSREYVDRTIYQIWTKTWVIVAHQFYLWFCTSCSTSKRGRLKLEWRRKLRPNFEL